MKTQSFRFKTEYENSPNAYILTKTYSDPVNLCLEVHDPHFGLICVATTNVAGHVCPPGHVLIKDWSENAGVFKALYEAGVIGPVQNYIKTGFVRAYECEFLLKAED